MAPIIVLILWFSIYFWEVIQVRLKMQEAARFATWEFTAYPLHDYEEGTGSRFDEVENEVTDLTLRIYEDLDSSDIGTHPGAPVSRNTFLATGWELERVRIREGTPPDVTGEFWTELGLDLLLTVEAWIESMLTSVTNPYAAGPVIWTTRSIASIDRRWGFNQRGWVTTNVQATVHNLMVPRSFRYVTDLSFEQDRWVRPRLRMRESASLLADSWRLNDGSDVTHGREDGGYYEQVNRIFLLNRSRATAAIAAMQALRAECIIAPMSGLLPVPQQVPNATHPVVVSLNHHVGEDGRVQLQTDGGRDTFDTTPLTVEHENESDDTTWWPYRETLDNRGEYFMGCEESMNATCGAGLGTGNPFGDGVHWPPPEG